MYMKIFKCFRLKYIQDAILVVTLLCLEPSTRALNLESKAHCDTHQSLKPSASALRCVYVAFVRSSEGWIYAIQKVETLL